MFDTIRVTSIRSIYDMKHLGTGIIAERYVARYLASEGYDVLACNWRKPWGEIDIIAGKDGILVFIEVKAGRSLEDGFAPELHANKKKMQKVLRTAQTYLAQNEISLEKEWRIDIISVIMNDKGEAIDLRHYENIEF